MTKEALKKEMRKIINKEDDTYKHKELEDALLKYVNNKRVSESFNDVPRSS